MTIKNFKELARGCEEIIPNWLRFIPGVIDSQDISLNISREMLQNNPIITKIKKGITTKILNEITTFSSKEVDTYHKFWSIKTSPHMIFKKSDVFNLVLRNRSWSLTVF